MVRNIAILFILFGMLAFIPADNAAFKGTITVSGTPIKDVDVMLRKVPGRTAVGNTMTDGKGNFEFQDIPQGDFEIITGYFPVESETARIEGKFYYFSSPLDEAVIKILDESGMAVKSVITDNKGKFSVSGFEPGEYKILITSISGSGQGLQ